MKKIKGESPFSKCELRDCKISEHEQYQLLHKITVFTSFARLKKSLISLNFFQLLANHDVKVIVTQRISTKIHSELDSLSDF